MTETFKMEKLDHGVLSMPNRTKNINADLDKYKAEQAKNEKRNLEDRKFKYDQEQILAKELFEKLEKKHFQYYATRACIKLSLAKAELKETCANPKKAIRLFNAIFDVVESLGEVS